MEETKVICLEQKILSRGRRLVTMTSFVFHRATLEKLRAKARENARKWNESPRHSQRFPFSSFPLLVYSGPVKFSGYLVNTASSFFVFFRELGIVHRDHNRRGSGENRPSSLLLNEKKNLYLCFKQHSSLSIRIRDVVNIQKVVIFWIILECFFSKDLPRHRYWRKLLLDSNIGRQNIKIKFKFLSRPEHSSIID